MKWYPYGHDFGNAEIGGAVDVGSQHLQVVSIPTALAKIDVAALSSLGITYDTHNNHIIQLHGDDHSYAVGDLALSQAAKDAWNGRGYVERYAEKHSIRAMLTAAATMISDVNFGLYVVTGLPTETFMKNVALRESIKNLSGEYTFTTDNGVSYRTARVEIGTVVMEGAGALMLYSDARSKSDAAVIDIGGRTIDLFVARNQVPVLEYCKGKPLGVESAALFLKSSCEMKYNCTLTDLETRTILRAYAASDITAYPVIMSYGKAISPMALHEMAKSALTDVGRDILSFVASSWNETDQGKYGSRFNPLLNVGGGVFYFYNVLKEKIPHLARPTDPAHANALGYCTLAGRQLTNKLLEGQLSA